MSWLSKTVKKVAPIVAPLPYLTNKPLAEIIGGKKPGEALKGTVADIIDPLLNLGKKPGVPNPFGIPDLSFLSNPIDLTKGYKPVDTTNSDQMFNDLLTNIGGQNQNDTAQLNNLLNTIGINEKNTVGNLKSDFQDRGLNGPGQLSDIEANALAQARSGADTTRATATADTIGKGLDRLATAYGGRYQGGLDTAKTNAATFNELLKSGGLATADQSKTLAQLLVSLYQGGAKNNIDTQQPGYLDNFLRNINLGVTI